MKLDTPLEVQGQTVEPSETLKVLGVYLDKKLSGKAQARQALSRVPKLLAAMKTLQGSTWGATLSATRKVYLGMVRPAITYGALAWGRPEALGNNKTLVIKLQAAQGKFLRVVAGAYKATATEALEAEIKVQPLDLHVE